MKTGNSLSSAAKIEPRLASVSFGAPSVRWTMYWSVHQYQSPMTGGHAAGFLDRRPRGLDSLGNQRLPQIEHLGTANGPQFGPPSERLQAEERHQHGPQHKHQGLQGLGVGHRAQTAQHGVGTREHDHQDGANPEAVQRSDSHVRQQDGEHDPARKDAHRDLGHDVGDQRDHRQHPAAGGIEPPFQELGHGEDLRPHVERDQHPPQNQQTPRVQFVMGHRHAVGGAGARQADQMLRADVRSEDRGPHHPPAKIPAGQEVVVGRVLVLGDHPPGDAQQQAKIPGDYYPVQCFHGRVLSNCGGGGWGRSSNRRSRSHRSCCLKLRKDVCPSMNRHSMPSISAKSSICSAVAAWLNTVWCGPPA